MFHRVFPLALLCFAMPLLATPEAKTDTATVNAIPPSKAEASLRSPGALCFDCRPAGDFEKAHIPGSIAMPLASIKNFPMLKGKKIVLVSDGLLNKEELGVVAGLGRDGAPVSLLEGGLGAWRQAGFKLAGSAPQATLNDITPERLCSSLGDGKWLALYFPDERKGAAVRPERDLLLGSLETLVVDKSARQDAGRLKTMLGERDAKDKKIVVFNDDGFGYGRLAPAVESAPSKGVYYLQGGVAGFNRFSNAYVFGKPKEVTTARKGCGCKK